MIAEDFGPVAPLRGARAAAFALAALALGVPGEAEASGRQRPAAAILWETELTVGAYTDAQPAVPEGLTVAPTARTTDELLASWTAVAGCYREHDSNEVAGAMPWEEDA